MQSPEAKRPLSGALLCASLLPFAMFVPEANFAFLIPWAEFTLLLYYVARKAWLTAGLVCFWLTFALSLRLLPWPLPYLVPLIFLVVLAKSIAPMRGLLGQFSLGRADRSTLRLSAITVAGSSFALWTWVATAHPDMSAMKAMIPNGSVFALIATCLAFSLANAIWEECLVKGVLWESLEQGGLGPNGINVVQSLAFGLMHLAGFPSGWLGAGLAACYGFFIGIIRKRAGGLGAPIATHFFADVTIFILVATH